jgi:hypothetical protein
MFMGVPFMPQCFNLAAELTFPMNPAIISGGLLISLYIMTFIFGAAFNFILQLNDETYVNYTAEEINIFEQRRSYIVLSTMIICSSIAAIIISYIPEDLKRTKYAQLQLKENERLTSHDYMSTEGKKATLADKID